MEILFIDVPDSFERSARLANRQRKFPLVKGD